MFQYLSKIMHLRTYYIDINVTFLLISNAIPKLLPSNNESFHSSCICKYFHVPAIIFTISSTFPRSGCWLYPHPSRLLNSSRTTAPAREISIIRTRIVSSFTCAFTPMEPTSKVIIPVRAIWILIPQRNFAHRQAIVQSIRYVMANCTRRYRILTALIVRLIFTVFCTPRLWKSAMWGILTWGTMGVG